MKSLPGIVLLGHSFLMSRQDYSSGQFRVDFRPPTVVRYDLCFNDAVTRPQFVIGTFDAQAYPFSTLSCLNRITVRTSDHWG